MPIKKWEAGMSFPAKSEMRKFTCPAWWYQAAEYKLKPEWDCCIFGGSFSCCKNFATKENCWKRWDEENKK